MWNKSLPSEPLAFSFVYMRSFARPVLYGSLLIAIAQPCLAQGPFAEVVFCPPSEGITPLRRGLRMADGTYALLLRRTDPEENGSVIMKLDEQGAPLSALRVWSNNLPDRSAYEFEEGPSGSLITIQADTISGQFTEGWQSRDLVRINSSGGIDWARRIWYQLSDSALIGAANAAFDVDGAGNIFVDASSDERPQILKFDMNGNFQWGRAVYDPVWSIGPLQALRADENGGCYYTARRSNVEVIGERVVLGRLSGTGELLFHEQLEPAGGAAAVLATDLQLRSDGSALISGERYWGSDPSEGLLMSTTPTGAVQWIHSYARNGSMGIYSTSELGDGSLAARYQAFSQSVLLLDAQGEVLGATEAYLDYVAGSEHVHGYQDLMPVGPACALAGWYSIGNWPNTQCFAALRVIDPQEMDVCGMDTSQVTLTDITADHQVFTNTATVVPVAAYSQPVLFSAEALAPYDTAPFC